ncbi:hypothetical protein [Pedobacter antarcticus]|uniref:hypothetical protein n=1 Tax=Pedobacter antarcticus TaxID=34086 RepID=UPI0029308FCE|nr:hypothetical protein [Pedobacter antarcticus]
MNKYYLNGIDLIAQGIIPGQSSGSNLALSGAWDMPSRIGKIYQEWPDDHGLEPYLRADELFYSGRDIIFNGYIKANNKVDALTKINDINQILDSFTETVPLVCKWGEFIVYIRDLVTIEYVSQGYSKIQMTFREPVVNLIGIIPSVASEGHGIDGISFSKLGIVKMKTTDQFNRPATKNAEYTSYGTESYKIGKRSFRELNIRFLLKKDTYEDFKLSIQALYALFSKPGTRTLTLEDGSTRECFIKDGFSVTGVRKKSNMVFAFVDVKFTEIRLLETWNRFTDVSGLILTDSAGKTLTEILKMN